MEENKQEIESEESILEEKEEVNQISEKELKKAIARDKRKKVFSIVFKGSKILVIVAFFYTAIIMYRLGNFSEAITIAFGASFFLILNKLESTWG